MRLTIHVATGLIIALWRFPRSGERQRRQLIRWWSRQLLRVLAVRVSVSGHRPLARRCLLVSNHISWLDIFLIQSRVPAVFVAKAEIRAWPAIGFLCQCAGTIFLERGSSTSARKATASLANAMAAGHPAGIFPEGTTTMGKQVAPFHRALFQAAIDSGATVRPVLIRYLDRKGRYTGSAAYVGETSLMESLWRILATRAMVAELRFLADIEPAGESRQTLARHSQAVIADALLQCHLHGPGIPAGPPASAQ